MLFGYREITAASLAALMLLSWFVAFPSAGPATVVGVWPELVGLPVVAEFTISVNVTDIVDLYGFDVSLTYDSTLLQGLNVTLGTFFFCREHLELIRSISDAQGKVRVAVTLTGDQTGLTGDGVLFQASFRVIGVGSAPFDIVDDQLQLADSSAQPIVPGDVRDGLFDNRAPEVSFTSVTVFSTTVPRASEINTQDNSETCPNATPVLSQVGNQSVEQGMLLSFTVEATDADGDSLSFSLGQASEGIFPDGATINATSGVFFWTPGSSQGPGVYSVRIIVSDGSDTDYQDVTVTVTSTSRAASPGLTDWLPWVGLGLVVIAAVLVVILRARRREPR